MFPPLIGDDAPVAVWKFCMTMFDDAPTLTMSPFFCCDDALYEIRCDMKSSLANPRGSISDGGNGEQRT